jgi:hypothetical protein
MTELEEPPPAPQGPEPLPDLLEPASPLDDARAALAQEWRAANPRTLEDIEAFYRDAQCLGQDLEQWHAYPERKEWERLIVHVAREAEATIVVDIGAGAGHDLLAIRDACPHTQLHAVEPNLALHNALVAAGLYAWHTITPAPVEQADLLLCIDVLEHIPDPATFLAGIATRARMDCLLVESTATFDAGTPLHLAANRGWHPGATLEAHGWVLVDRDPTGRLRVWRRQAAAGRERASLLLCAYRQIAAETMGSIFSLCAGNTEGWRLRMKNGDALISRSRSIVVTKWWQETADDVFLMVDDDIVFAAADANRLVDLCREGHDIICAAYPVHNGGHLAAKCLPETKTVAFRPGEPPLEIRYAATGFMACHRRVIDAMAERLPLCHPNEVWSFYPLFHSAIIEEPGTGPILLSEDWTFCEEARKLGFNVWLDPQTKLTHLGQVGISVNNMQAMYEAINKV